MPVLRIKVNSPNLIILTLKLVAMSHGKRKSNPLSTIKYLPNYQCWKFGENRSIRSLRSNDGLKSQDLESLWVFFGKTTPYGKLSRFCSESFHRLTDWRFVFKRRKIYPTGNRRNCALFRPTSPKTNLGLHRSETVATARIAPKMCQSQQPTFGSHCSRFYPNRFTFGVVIAERINTVLLPRRAFPIFAE